VALGRPGDEAYTQSQETSASRSEALLLQANGLGQVSRGKLYLGRGDYHDAELDERDAIAVFDAQGTKPEEPQLGFPYRASLTILATAYYRAGEYGKAEPLYRRVGTGWAKTEKYNPQTASSGSLNPGLRNMFPLQLRDMTIERSCGSTLPIVTRTPKFGIGLRDVFDAKISTAIRRDSCVCLYRQLVAELTARSGNENRRKQAEDT
jgi:hypothetical protein